MDSDPYMGSVSMTAFPWAPTGWALCDGSIVAIDQNTALYSLIGNLFGGNGTTTFALPDLRGRMPLGAGAGPDLTPRQTGTTVGTEAWTLNTDNLPAHSHEVALGPAGSGTSAGAVGAPGPTTSTVQTGETGGGTPIPLMPPASVITFQIALDGLFPARS
jgi:microcystin-dependent protein